MHYQFLPQILLVQFLQILCKVFTLMEIATVVSLSVYCSVNLGCRQLPHYNVNCILINSQGLLSFIKVLSELQLSFEQYYVAISSRLFRAQFNILPYVRWEIQFHLSKLCIYALCPILICIPLPSSPFTLLTFLIKNRVGPSWQSYKTSGCS